MNARRRRFTLTASDGYRCLTAGGEAPALGDAATTSCLTPSRKGMTMSDTGFGPVGDPPIIYDTFTKDGYGRTTPLVDRRLLEQAQAWAAWLIAEQEHEYETALDELERERDDPCSQTNQNAAAWRVVASHPLIGAIEKLPERGTYAEMVRARLDALAAERDHWRAEAEKARTPDASNPAHWRFAADLIPGHWRLRSGDTAVAGIFRREADRLESEATADDVVEKATDTEALELLKTDPQEYLRRTHRDLPPSFRRGDR